MHDGIPAAETVVHPAVLLLVGGLIVLSFILPRRHVFAPLFVTIFFIPLVQTILVGGLHFTMIRIVCLFAWLRLLLRRSPSQDAGKFHWNSIDKILILWVISSVITFTVLWGSVDAFINRLGLLYNAFGIYFLLRLLCRDAEDSDRIIKVLAVISLVVAFCMVNEQVTGRNMFALFGGVPEFTPIREGQLRSQGAFAHSILAGAFGATLMPLFAGLCWQGKKSRLVGALGCIAATSIVITCKSSTPLLGYAAGIIALFMWPLRKRMKIIRWGIALVLLSLHLVMKAPVWALIGRVSVVSGSSSFHRYELIDQFIRRFGEWWMVGTTANAQWGLDTWDLANQYVNVGVNGGLITLILFVCFFVQGFKHLGITRRAVEGNVESERRVWALGSALFATLVSFFGIYYYDQTIALWYTLLALISTTASAVVASAADRETSQVTPYTKSLSMSTMGEPGLPLSGSGGRY